METAKTNLLDAFYRHVDENDWIEGLDLYQAGKVARLDDHSGLITAKISAGVKHTAEVRLKIHPNGKRIQWIECTCTKYRSSGQYCEHMAAFMINMDREKPQILSKLDAGMLATQPTKSRKKKRQAEPPQKVGSIERLEGAAQKILSHLKGNIHSTSLLAKGPNIRVRIEIKPGTITHYNLELDDAAKFLLSHPKLKVATDDIKKLKVYSRPIVRGTRFYLEDEEKIVAERVFAIKHTKLSSENIENKDQRFSSTVAQAAYYDHDKPKGAHGIFEFISVKSANKFIGAEYLFIPGRGYWILPTQETADGWAELPLKKNFQGDKAASLLASKFAPYTDFGPIWLDQSLRSPEITSELNLTEIKVQKASGGWFYLNPKYKSGDSDFSMIEILKHYRDKKRNYYKSGENWIKIPDFVKDAGWEVDDSGKFLKVDTIGLMRLKASMGDFDSFVGSKKILDKIRNQLEFRSPRKLPTLEKTNLNLREYQNSGFEWLWWLYENNLHGLLADEMGLGKTHQAMAVLSAIQEAKEQTNFMVVCPTSVIDHWIEKIEEFCPNLNPLRYHGASRSAILQRASNMKSFTIITSYGILLRDIKALSNLNWTSVVLDEAHFIKNQVTSTYKAVCRLNAEFRLCLTGTPMENHLGELKNIFDFLMPGYFGSDDYFKKNFISPINEGGNPEKELVLQKLLHPFKMRRIKEHVLSDLPPKTEDIRLCELSKQQVKLYKETIALKARPLIKTLESEQENIPFLHVLQTLTILKQICNHPALAMGQTDYTLFESGKFEAFKELIGEALDSGRKIVVYSQYTKMIKIISDYLSDISIGHLCLTGKSRNRGKIIKDFQTHEKYRVFCGSLRAGGIGIDLTAASVVIHYDRWWNASKENQATDRVHRIGQSKNINVYKMVTKGTLEEKIDRLISSKQLMFEKFLNKDEEVFKKLDRKQLIELLS